MVSPEAMLITSVAVACLGLTVMLLKRPHTEQLLPGGVTEGANPEYHEEPKPAPGMPGSVNGSCGTNEAVVQGSAAEATMPAALPATEGQPANGTATDSAVQPQGRLTGEAAVTSPAVEPAEGKLWELPPAAGAARVATRGASALIAKVATLLPAGVGAPREGMKPTAKAWRGSGGFQPGGRFSRSQQAFLRIPVILTGHDESGSEFREEAFTLILLPQGAVIPMRQKVRAGERLTLSNPARQKEAACNVFGVQTGPDGKLLVEVEFPEPQKSMWPVSFPAWAGKSPASAPASQPPRADAEEQTPMLNRSGS